MYLVTEMLMFLVSTVWENDQLHRSLLELYNIHIDISSREYHAALHWVSFPVSIDTLDFYCLRESVSHWKYNLIEFQFFKMMYIKIIL